VATSASRSTGGRSAHSHTWGARPVSGAQKVEVEVLDSPGKSLKKDSVAIER
jgi:hypothetical protein